MRAVSMVPPSTSAGARLGRYDVVGVLATGGMAEILLAKLRGPSGFERAVVVKRILPHYAAQREFVAMFLDEGRIAARLAHPNVVLVHELAEEDGELFLVMEYLQGESLAGVMRRAKLRGVHLDPALVAFVIAEACAGLHAAHELTTETGSPMGLVHRDVSPQNVFVTYHGVVKILDFGIAKAADRITQTEAGSLKGKYEYMSPQQALGEPIDRRSDVFSLGVVLYELLTEARLFRRQTPLATLRAVTDDAVVPPREVRASCPEELDRICMKALSREPDQRYATAYELRRDLLAFVRKNRPDEPAEALATLLSELFGDRVRAKEELLQNLARNVPVAAVPDANVDAAVELPEVASLVTRPSPVRAARAPGATPVSPASSSRGRMVTALTLGAVIVVCAGAAAAWPSSDAPPAPVAAPVPTAPTIATPPSAAEVSVAFETEPAGAHVVIDGSDRGTTPVSLTLPRGEAPLAVTLELDGHVPLERAVVPDLDQRVVVSLVRARASSGRSRRPRAEATAPAAGSTPPSVPSSSATPERGFRRFD